MTDERWKEIITKIKNAFEVSVHETEELPENVGKGTVEYIEFEGPLGKMRLERTTQAVVLDKKTLGSRRIGGETAVQYVYSDDEVFHKFSALQWNDVTGEWDEMKMDRGEMIF